MAEMLSVNNLSLKIADKLVCKNLSFSISDNQCLGILGANGVGKTTLLHTIAGLNPDYQGQIIVAGKPLAKYKAKEKAQTVAILLQQQFSFPVTVLELALNSRFAYSGYWGRYSAEDVSKVQNSLKMTQLLSKSSQIVTTLSGGEFQRLAISMLLAQEPKLYLLDEPVNNLDLKYHLLVEKFFSKNSGRTSIVILHDLALITKMCSHLLLLKNGDWVFGTMADIFTLENMQWLFDIKMQAVNTGSCQFFVPQ